VRVRVCVCVGLCDVSASLTGRSLGRQEPPQFFQRRKNENVTMAPMEIGEIVGIRRCMGGSH